MRSIYEEEYQPIAQIEIRDSLANSGNQLRVKTDDVITIGDLQYHVLAVIETFGIHRGFVALGRKLTAAEAPDGEFAETQAF